MSRKIFGFAEEDGGLPPGLPFSGSDRILAFQSGASRQPTVDGLLSSVASLVGADLVSANEAAAQAAAAAASLTYASEEEAVDKTIEARALDPKTIDTFLQQRLGYFPIERYAPSYTDLTQAFVDARADATSAGGGIIRFGKSGQFKTGNIELPDNVLLMADGDVTLALHADIGSGNYLFKKTKQANPITTTVADTSLSKGQATVTLTSATGFAAGDFITLESAEYFTGIPGVSGFGVEGKSERNRIKSLAGNVATLHKAIAEDWNVSGYPVTVTKENLHRKVGIHGLKAVGTGIEFSGPRFIDLDGVHDVLLDVAFDRCGNGSVRLNNVDTFAIYGDTGLLEGYNPADASKISDQYGGFQLQGVTNGLISGLRGARLRRLMNFDKVDGSIIPRGVTVIGVHAESCLNGWGTHICSDIAFVASRGDKSPFYYRGKDPTLIGCRFSAVGTDTSSAAVLLGNTDAAAFSENPSVGIVNIQHNRIFSMNVGLYSRCSVDGGIIGANYFDVKGHGAWFIGKVSKALAIEVNTFDRRRGTNGASSYGIYFQNGVANNLPQMVEDITGRGNKFYNYIRAWYVEGSADINTPFKNIVTESDYQDGANGSAASFMFLGGGYFGPNVGAMRCRATGPLSSGQFVHVTQDRSRFWQPPINHENICLGVGSPVTSLVLASYSLGTRRTLVVGQRIIINPPIAGEYREYDVLVSGTIGAFPSVTGSMTSGSALLTFASDPNDGVASTPYVFPGIFLTVNGAGSASANMKARVISWNQATGVATLDTAAGTTVTGATVSYAAPTVKGSCMMAS